MDGGYDCRTEGIGPYHASEDTNVHIGTQGRMVDGDSRQYKL